MSNELDNLDEDELDEELLEEFPPYDLEELTKEEILSDMVMNYLVSLKDSTDKVRTIEKVKEKARELKVLSAFNNILKQKNKELSISNVVNYNNTLNFPEMDGIAYNTNRYELGPDNSILEVIPNIGKILVCYHPIVPIQTYTNLEDNSVKVKIGYYVRGKWKDLIVDKSIISSTQGIIKLSDSAIEVNSETAKFLIKYLAEIENLNRDIIPDSVSVSRLGWFDNKLVPYTDEIQVDSLDSFPNLKDMFGQKGTLESWIDFFKERRKNSVAARLIMAASVVSILLDKIKQPGFTLHVWGTSENGKSVACMAAQSIFGNPSLGNKGIGVNFNFTINGLESILNKYNNIPLFINEMQHQKDAKDYDKILFLITEGKGKTRSNKNIGISKQNDWHNVVITNGEKNIIKDNSNAGAYNRCFSYELKEHSYENLPEVADFVKDNYGTPIRKILEKIEDFDVKAIYEKELEKFADQDTTNKQKILQALILTGDKILTDIIFKDEFYLKEDELSSSVISKKDTDIDERAFEVILDWYVSESRHFWNKEDDKADESKYKVEIYGRKLDDNSVAFIPTILKKKLEENGFDGNETLSAWKRKGYLKCESSRNTMRVRIDGKPVYCVVLMFKDDDENDENMEMPF